MSARPAHSVVLGQQLDCCPFCGSVRLAVRPFLLNTHHAAAITDQCARVQSYYKELVHPRFGPHAHPEDPRLSLIPRLNASWGQRSPAAFKSQLAVTNFMSKQDALCVRGPTFRSSAKIVLHIQIAHVQCVLFNKFPPGFHFVAHQDTKHLICCSCVCHGDFE